MTDAREEAITRAYNIVTGQDDENWTPDSTLDAIRALYKDAVCDFADHLTRQGVYTLDIHEIRRQARKFGEGS